MASATDLLADRLEELLTAAWPNRMTSTELAEKCGMMHSTWGWCSGWSDCLIYTTRSHIRNVTHHDPVQWRQWTDKNGTVHGWDTYDVPVSLQQVNPALNKLHRAGRVLKEKPQPGSRSCLWAALDMQGYAEAEAEAMEILRQTIERMNRPPEPELEPEPPPPEPDLDPEPAVQTPVESRRPRIVFC